MFLPSTSTSCQLPSLEVERENHSQDGLLLCGGTFSSDTYEEFSPATGTWARTNHTLQEERGMGQSDHI